MSERVRDWAGGEGDKGREAGGAKTKRYRHIYKTSNFVSSKIPTYGLQVEYGCFDMIRDFTELS